MDVQPSEMLSDARFQEIVKQMGQDKDIHGYSTMQFALHLLDLADELFVSREQVSEAGHKYDIRNAELELMRLSGLDGYVQQAYAGPIALYRMVGRGKERYKTVYKQKLAHYRPRVRRYFSWKPGSPEQPICSWRSYLRICKANCVSSIPTTGPAPCCD